MRGTLVHLVAAAALAGGIAVLLSVPGVFTAESGDTVTVVTPAKRPLRTVVYAAGARAVAHPPAPARSTPGSIRTDGGAVVVASHRHAVQTRELGATIGHPRRPAQSRTLAGEPAPVNEKADIETFQRRDEVADVARPPAGAERSSTP